MSDIDKFKLMEKIKLSALKHRGDVVAVSRELNLDLQLVQKCVKKLQKRDSRDVNRLISSTLMEHLFFGYNSRVAFVMEMLHSLDGRHQITVSNCCRHAVGNQDGKLVCLACRKECLGIVLDQHGVYDLKQQLLEQLRTEDKTLVEFAEKMGYTEKQEQAPTVKVEDKRQYLFMGNMDAAKELSKLEPIEREQLRLKLEKELTENTDGEKEIQK